MSELTQLSDRIDTVALAVDKISDQVTGSNQRIADLSTEVAKLGALLKANLERQGDERGVLFRGIDEHRARIANIERDYVSHAGCEKQRAGTDKALDEIKAEQAASKMAIQDLRTQMAKVMAWAGIVAAVLTVIGNVAVKMLWK